MASSSGWRSFSMSGMVRLRYIHLLVSSCDKAAYAACGWLLAIWDRRSTS